MRKKRDAQGTKARVLEAAEKLFAQSGYSATSLARISRASGISGGLILYHFQSKEKLYAQVIERISARYLAVLEGLGGRDLAPPEMMRESLKAVFDFWSRDRTYNRISLWAYLEGRADQAASEARLTAGLAGYLSSLQASGAFPREIHPAVFLSAITGPIHFWVRYRGRFAEVLRLEDSGDRLNQTFLEQFTWMLTRFFADSSPGPGVSPAR